MGKALIFDGLSVASPLDTVTFTQISEEAELMGSYFGDAITNNQLTALNVLVTELKAAGTFGKLRYLMIPMLASDVEKAAQNLLMKSDRVPDVTHLILYGGELKNDGSGTTITNLSNQMVSPSQSMDFSNHGASFGFYVSEASAENQTFLTVGSYRAYRNSGTVQAKKDTESSSVFAVGNNFLNDPLASFSCSFDSENYELSASKVVGDGNITTKSVTSSAALVNFDGEVLKLYGQFDGGIKLLWVGEELTNAQLTATHSAFKKFVNTLAELSGD